MPSSRYATPLTQDELNSVRKAAVPKKTADERQLTVLKSVERLSGVSIGMQCDLPKKIPVCKHRIVNSFHIKNLPVLSGLQWDHCSNTD